MRAFEFHVSAIQEIHEAESFYLREAPHVVEDFRADVKSTLDRIRIDPGSYAFSFGSFRSLAMQQFPYVFHFREIDFQTVFVVAVSHTSRRPRYWRTRV